MQWNKIFNLQQYKRLQINNNINKEKCFLIKNREINQYYKRIDYLYILIYDNQKYLLTDKTKQYFNDIRNVQINNFYQCQDSYIVLSKICNNVILYISDKLKNNIYNDKVLQKIIYHYYYAWKR